MDTKAHDIGLKCDQCGSTYLIDCHTGHFLCGDCGNIVDDPEPDPDADF